MMYNMSHLYACKLGDCDMYLNYRERCFVELNGLSHSRSTS